MKMNCMVDVAFTVILPSDEGITELDLPIIFAALEKRINDLKKYPKDAVEAFDICDSFEEGD